MVRRLVPVLLLVAGGSCAPAAVPTTSPDGHGGSVSPPEVVVEPSPVEEPPLTPPSGDAPQSQSHACRCDILGFESDGPPAARCELVVAEDGTAELESVTAEPSFTAQLRPDDHYGFEGRFDLACDEPWCGGRELTVHEVGELDYRVTVARSNEGPPSHVLWVTCK